MIFKNGGQKVKKAKNRERVFRKLKGVVALVLSMFTLLSTLCACERNEGIPKLLAFQLVDFCEYDEPTEYRMTQKIEHKYDDRSHMDSATLITQADGNYGSYISTCNASFIYDRTSDLWSLLRAEEWSSPEYSFNDALEGKWEVGNTFNSSKGQYVLEIVEVKRDTITLNYQISQSIYGGLFTGDTTLEMEGSATVPNSSENLWIPIDLPKGFYADRGETSTDLCVYLDINDGVKSAYISGQLTYVE